MDSNAAAKGIIIVAFLLTIVGIALGVKAITPRFLALGEIDMARTTMVDSVMQAKMYTYPDNKEGVDNMSFIAFSEIVYDVDLAKKVHNNLTSAVEHALAYCDKRSQERIDLTKGYFSTEMPVGEYMSRLYRLDRACFDG